MRKNIFLILAMVGIFSSCSKDFLITVPTSSTSAANIFSTTENAKLAISGINKLMCRTWASFGQGYNGEGTIKLYYNEYQGDILSVAALSTYTSLMNGDTHAKNTDLRSQYAWYYYYMVIANANTLLANIDNAKGSDAEKMYLKAQALCYRAYSFFNLSQIYSVRWMDSNNGQADGVILRLDCSSDSRPLSTLAETYQRVYTDLDEAIKLFKESGISRSKGEFWVMDIDVAYAIYARAAITRQDYSKALEMAQLARKNYPLMTNAEYNAGFSTGNQEWIFGSYGCETESLVYYSFQAYVGYNGVTSQCRNYPKCITIDLYNKIPETDIRRALFLNPGKMTYSKTTGKANAELKNYAYEYAAKDGRLGYSTTTFSIYAYMQYKFCAMGQPGIGDLNHFRSSEMYLIEAEAQHFLNQDDKAQKLLVELTKESGRDPGYSCTKTGDDLFKEIKLYRSIELWGEGFIWFDLKRWGDGISRKSFADGGNYIASVAVSYGPHDKNEWTWVIPNIETDYNDEL